MATRKTTAATLKAAILKLLYQRAAGKTICPSEAARTVAGGGEMSNDRERWEPLMPVARRAAQQLADAGTIAVTQRGHAVADANTQKGPIRLRLR